MERARRQLPSMPSCNSWPALQGQEGVIGAAWLTAAGHGRWVGSPRGPKPAVAEGHIDLGSRWCGCGLTEVRVD